MTDYLNKMCFLQITIPKLYKIYLFMLIETNSGRAIDEWKKSC